MAKNHGKRSNTRKKFKKDFRKSGMPTLTKYLTNYKIGQFVDIVVDPAIHKGMPYKYYCGRTGRIWDITPRAVGVILSKRVGGRIMNKKLHVRVEHIRPSRCRAAFVEQCKVSDALKAEAKTEGRIISTKRLPAQPKKAQVVKFDGVVDVVAPVEYVELY
ncbi:hypothetical protein PCE1_001109 [Barthelona sp. PCE]